MVGTLNVTRDLDRVMSGSIPLGNTASGVALNVDGVHQGSTVI